MKFWAVRAGSIALALGFSFLLQAFAAGQSSFTQQLMVLAALAVTLAVSLNLINGITGQFSMGHAAFYQVGAYTSMYVGKVAFSQYHGPVWVWLILMIFAGAIMAAIAGLVVGLPSLRLKGDYLAVVTLGFGEIVRIVVQNQPALGSAGGADVNPHENHLAITVMLAIICIAMCRNLLKTAHGLPFLSVREDEVASSAMGVNVTRTKVTAFVLGSMFAGAAGAIYANSLGAINPDLFKMDTSFIILTMVVLGGTGSITGSAVAALVLFYIPEKMRDLTDIHMSLILGIGLAVGLSVAAVRWVMNNLHRGPQIRAAAYAGIVAAGFAFAILVDKVLWNVPAFHVQVAGAKLRLVVFAVTLIVIMLIRPQGVFAHHEFSWDWVKGLFGFQTPKRKVPA